MNSLRIALLGYGRMGKTIEELAQRRGHAIILRATRHSPATAAALSGADVAMDFSCAEAVAYHGALCSEVGIPLVIGTTGWNLDDAFIRSVAERIPVVIGANFSVGIAIVSRLAAELAQMLHPPLEYQIHVHEMHHRAKQDAPSGTALLLARTIAEHSAIERPILPAPHKLPPPSEAITISSARVGLVAGTHTIVADSEADTIELTHRAKSRHGFALGAILAAEWIRGKQPGIYHFPAIAFDVFAAAWHQRT